MPINAVIIYSAVKCSAAHYWLADH